MIWSDGVIIKDVWSIFNRPDLIPPRPPGNPTTWIYGPEQVFRKTVRPSSYLVTRENIHNRINPVWCEVDPKLLARLRSDFLGQPLPDSESDSEIQENWRQLKELGLMPGLSLPARTRSNFTMKGDNAWSMLLKKHVEHDDVWNPCIPCSSTQDCFIKKAWMKIHAHTVCVLVIAVLTPTKAASDALYFTGSFTRFVQGHLYQGPGLACEACHRIRSGFCKCLKISKKITSFLTTICTVEITSIAGSTVWR